MSGYMDSIQADRVDYATADLGVEVTASQNAYRKNFQAEGMLFCNCCSVPSRMPGERIGAHHRERHCPGVQAILQPTIFPRRPTPSLTTAR